MSSSLRSRRMARNHRRMARPAKLNLVALMDIFTILVLFLIVNNGDVEVLQSDQRIALPESVSEQRPGADLVIKVTETDILVAERVVMEIPDALDPGQGALEPLARALAAASRGATALADDQAETGRSVVVMGDADTSYAVLKRVLATCAASDYRDVALAVNSRPASAEEIASMAANTTGIAL